MSNVKQVGLHTGQLPLVTVCVKREASGTSHRPAPFGNTHPIQLYQIHMHPTNPTTHIRTSCSCNPPNLTKPHFAPPYATPSHPAPPNVTSLHTASRLSNPIHSTPLLLSPLSSPLSTLLSLLSSFYSPLLTRSVQLLSLGFL